MSADVQLLQFLMFTLQQDVGGRVLACAGFGAMRAVAIPGCTSVGIGSVFHFEPVGQFHVPKTTPTGLSQHTEHIRGHLSAVPAGIAVLVSFLHGAAPSLHVNASSVRVSQSGAWWQQGLDTRVEIASKVGV